MKEKNHLLEGPIGKTLITLAIPIIFANLLQVGYQLIDAFWVGRLGSSAIAAVSVTAPLFFLSIALGVGFSVAGSTLIAQYFGAKNYKMVDHVASQTLLAVVVVSSILGFIGYLLTPLILHAMGVAPDVYEGAVSFLRWSFVGLVFSFFFFMFQSVMRGVGEMKLPVYIVLSTVVLNFFLDPLLIFGWGPIPAMGVAGAAIATVGTQGLAAFVGLLILLKGKYGIHLSLQNFKPDPAFIKRVFLLGFPASIEQSARALGMIVLTFLIASFGTLTVATYGVASTILQVVIMPAIGLSIAVSTLVGQNIGAGNVERASQVGRLGAMISFGLFTGVGALVFVFAPYLVKLFAPEDMAVVESGAIFLRIMALSWGFMGIQFALNGVFRASGNMVTTMLLAIVSQWVLQFPLAYILSRHTSLGVNGLWWSFTITNILSALITVVWYRRGDWKKTQIITKEDRLVEKVSKEIIVEEGVRQRL